MALIDLDNPIVPLSVGSAKDAEKYRGATGLKNGFEVSLDLAVKNIMLIDRFVGGDDVRWLMVTTVNAQVPHTRQWVAISPLLMVENIQMAHKAVRAGVDTEGFEGHVDYVLINYLKHRQMVVCGCFDQPGDAILWKMRNPD